MIIKKSDFNKIGGFQTQLWPGEDTVLCLDLTKKLNKKILYHPSVRVFHHRRPILLPHLKQINRYARMRGLFVTKYPATSARFGYFLPSLFLLYILTLPLHRFAFPLYIYLALILVAFIKFLTQNSLTLSLLAALTIPLTHLSYGFHFLLGLSNHKV